jgi:hypothetical protein
LVRGEPLSTAGTGQCTTSGVTAAVSSTCGLSAMGVVSARASIAVRVPTVPSTAAPASGRAGASRTRS